MGWFSTDELITNMDAWPILAMQWCDSKGAAQKTVTAFREAMEAVPAAEAAINSVSLEGLALPARPKYADLIEILNVCTANYREYCNGIHYEIADLVDVPFATGMGDVMEAAFALDPYALTCSAGGVGAAPVTLASLDLPPEIDAALKESYAQVKHLPDAASMKALTDALADARYWEDQFVRMHECEALAEEYFNPARQKAWEGMTVAAREAYLLAYAQEIAVIMGCDPGLVGDIVLFSEIPGTEVPEDAGGFVYPSGAEIYVNDTSLTDPSNFLSVGVTIAHETRHLYQYKCLADAQAGIEADPPVPPQYLEAWDKPYPSMDERKRYSQKYWKHGLEVDARAFAAITAPWY